MPRTVMRLSAGSSRIVTVSDEFSRRGMAVKIQLSQHAEIQEGTISDRFVTGVFIVRNNQNGAEFIGSHGHATLLVFDNIVEDRASADFSALTATVTQKAILLACEALEGTKPQALLNFVQLWKQPHQACSLSESLYALRGRLQQGISEFDLICNGRMKVLPFYNNSQTDRFSSIGVAAILFATFRRGYFEELGVLPKGGRSS